MRARLPLLLALTGLAAWGFVREARPGEPVRGGPPVARTWQPLCAGKPAARIGDLVGLVVERPEGDEAVVRVDWARGPLGEGCRVELVLPQGATLLDGEPGLDLPDGVLAGSTSWRVRFPRLCTSDLTVRMCAALDGAMVSKETYVRLWECE
jgi:hypothetical protein